MVEQLQVKRLTMGTIFKLLFLGFAFSVIPFTVVMGILSFFDMSTVTWNNRPLTWVTGLVAAPFMGSSSHKWLQLFLDSLWQWAC